MTAPQIIERALTFNFAQSVSLSTGRPDIMEVAVLPLDDASSGTAGATFAGGLKDVTVELSAPVNTVTFNLIPTFSPGLNVPIYYRVMWRAGVMSRTFTYDFSMPDRDIDFDALASLGNIIDGASYLQQSDLGVPGRVARLDQNGNVVDSSGNPVATSGDVTTLTGEINVERVARQQADAQLRATLEGELTTQVNATLSTAQTYTDNQIIGVNGDLSTERSSRVNADADLQAQLTNAVTTINASVSGLNTSVTGINTALTHKADLDGNGTVPIAQIPQDILTNGIPVPNQAAMLALSTMVAHKGSIAIRPDGIWLLTTSDPTQLSNWTSLTTVSSINGQRGAVTLSAADVGAIPTGGSILMTQVTGLSTALSGKANNTDLATTNAAVAAILADATYVHTVSGVVPTGLMSADMVYINSVGQLVKKNGDIIPITGGGGAVFSVNNKTGLVVLTASDVNAIPVGGSITQTQVTGLTTALGNKADASTVSTLASATTTALSNKADVVSGLVPLGQIPVMPDTKITGLTAMIANNQLTSSSNAVNRIASLETAVAGGGGGGGGGGVSSTVPFYTSANTTTPVTDFTTVNLHSPWGIDSDSSITGTVGTWYYLYTGVRGQDVAYPYITPNGHLNLRKWNEANASDPVYALASDLTTLASLVNTKAAQADLVSLGNTVALKATQVDLVTLSGLVDTKASISNLNATNTAVASKANASDLANLSTTVGTKANQSDLTSLATTVASKADASALSTTNANLTTLNNALTTKADLVSGTVPLNQLAILPQAKVTGLVTALGLKADLVSGTVPLSQLPTNIPISSVATLGTTLGAKADLVAGVVPLSQIPLGALPNIQIVANRAAMLALTAAQVQFGDLCLITSTTDKGTYILTGNDPSQFVSWTLITTGDPPVVSVNTQVGTVVLTASDVGALAANAVIPISQITGLQASLDSKALATALTSGLAGKTSPADVQNMFFLSSMVKRADYVSSTAIASLAGQQSIDGVLVPNGAIVLATSQASSVNNGLWIVNAGGSWTRPADFATSSFLARDTIVVVSNLTGSANGSSNPYTVWQMTVNSGFIDSNSNNWTRIAWVAPPFVPVAGNGIALSGSTFSAKIDTGKGLVVTGTGLATDPNVTPSKFLGTVPSGSTVAGITHNLNTTSPVVQIWDTASNTMVLAGVTVVTANSISIEFASAPASGQYRVCVIG